MAKGKVQTDWSLTNSDEQLFETDETETGTTSSRMIPLAPEKQPENFTGREETNVNHSKHLQSIESTLISTAFFPVSEK